MVKAAVFLSAAFFMLIAAPAAECASYLYPGSAALQPLAVIEPVTPDSLFHTWTGDLELAGKGNLGFSLDNLRNDDNSADWDVIATATGAWRAGDRVLLGVTVPYIIRDPDYNESDLLDLRVFARARLFGRAPSFRVSGELSAILPTASEGEPQFPFSLQSPVVGARLALAGGSKDMRAGLTFGFQTYLDPESGDDSDTLYGLWVEKVLKGPWKVAGVYSGSRHAHSGAPGSEDASDSYLQAGIRAAPSDRTDLGLAVGGGIGAESVADLRITASATFRFGKTGTATGTKPSAETGRVGERRAVPSGGKPAAVYSGPVVVMVAEGVAGREWEKLVTRALQKSGFATGMDPDPGVRIPRRNVLLYNPGMQEQALRVSRALVGGGHLKDLRLQESKTPLAQNWMLLILGGERK